ncbi:hypothetical protein ACHQM5_021286 [Ranunculus cassubicifolius]
MVVVVEEQSTTISSSIPLLQPKKEANLITSTFATSVYLLWNLALLTASILVLYFTQKERPNIGIRLWISLDALQSMVAVILFVIYRYIASTNKGEEPSCFLTGCRIFNTALYFIWWIVGIFWVCFGGEILFRNAPVLSRWVVVLLVIPPLLIAFTICFGCCTDQCFSYTAACFGRRRIRVFPTKITTIYFSVL